MIARAVAAAVALLVCAWFALGARQAHDTTAATSIVQANSTLTRAQARDADALVHSAALLNPDQTVNILRGRVAVEGGRDAEARRILAAVTREEPRNLEAWVALASALPNNEKLFRQALNRVRQLEPRIPPRG
jgi:predicted Zn-dependent protease